MQGARHEASSYYLHRQPQTNLFFMDTINHLVNSASLLLPPWPIMCVGRDDHRDHDLNGTSALGVKH